MIALWNIFVLCEMFPKLSILNSQKILKSQENLQQFCNALIHLDTASGYETHDEYVE